MALLAYAMWDWFSGIFGVWGGLYVVRVGVVSSGEGCVCSKRTHSVEAEKYVSKKQTDLLVSFVKRICAVP